MINNNRLHKLNNLTGRFGTICTLNYRVNNFHLANNVYLGKLSNNIMYCKFYKELYMVNIYLH